MDPPNIPEGEQLEYYRNLAEQLFQKNNDLQKEFDDFTAESGQLEKELETTVDQKEKANRELRQQNQRLERETEFLKKKIDRFQQESTQMENELKALKNEKERHLSYIRELEQKNDDLERGSRVITESVAGVETLLHQAYEKNAVLESEVDEIENLRTIIQRLSDEARDLKQELRVKEKVPNGNTLDCSALKRTSLDQGDINKKLYNGHISVDSNRLTETETQTSLSGTPLKLADVTLNGNTMTPSSRISALNIVGDILRKVGLERFLCAECSKVRCICTKTVTPVKEIQTANVTMDVKKSTINNSIQCLSDAKIQISESNAPSDFRDKDFTDRNKSLTNTESDTKSTQNEKSNIANGATSRGVLAKDACLNLFRNSSIRRSNIVPKPPPRSPTKGRPNV